MEQDNPLAALMAQGQIPLPRPDPRGPPVPWPPQGQTNPNWPPQAQQQQQPYGTSDHLMALLRAVFEGTKHREEMMPYRDGSGLYNRRR